MNLQLENKVVVVSGGSKGIGAAIVRSFLAEGAVVAIINRDGPEGQGIADAAKSRGETCLFVAADLTESMQCDAAMTTILDEFGHIDVLVNNAGSNDGVSLEDGPVAFSESLARNLNHYYTLAHHAWPSLSKNGGNIVNIGSKIAETGQGGTSGYAAAKGAINALTREWAVDLAPYGGRANAVIPAEVWTPMYDRWLQTLPDPGETKGSIERSIPLDGRFTTAEEIADMTVFLASPKSSHTTGQIIYVDGGYTHFDRKIVADDNS